MLSTLLLASLCAASPVPDDPTVPTVVDAAARLSAVTVYPGRAAITRNAVVPMAPGLHEVRFTALPDSVQPDSIQARVSGAEARIVGVDYAEKRVVVAADPALAALDAKIEATKVQLTQLQEDAALLNQQEKLLDAIGVRAAGDASERGGTPLLNIDALKQQIDFLAAQRVALLKTRRELGAKIDATKKSLAMQEAERAARAGKGGTSREAVVTIAGLARGDATVELVYLVGNATWAPTYNVRGSLDQGAATIEYDALISQRTGEDWDDVALTLSTAEPTLAANPPVVQPWFVDVYVQPPPPPPAAPEAKSMAPALGRARPSDFGGSGGLVFDSPHDQAEIDKQVRADMERKSAAAEIMSGGPAVSFAIPRPVTVKTNADRQQRSRIATLDAKPEFLHVAAPLETDSVYLRGRLTNGSPYLLLAGAASVFLGNDFIGPTRLETIAPGAEFDVFFGIDRNLSARRTLVSRNTEKTGLFSGGVRITSDYRIEIDNPTARAAKVHITDRIPVSRNSQIEIELVGPSVPLSSDAAYVRDERPQGILGWEVTVPAGATGKNAFRITFGTRVSHGRDVRITGLPE